MENENVLIGKEAKEKLIKGVNIITDAIEQTYGPNGTNVMIKNQYGVHLTKDGKTVAESIHNSDSYVQAGIDIIKEISKKTADTVGDGSSTVALLTRAIINKFKDNPNPIQLSRDLQEECQKVIKYLSENKREISTKEDLLKVATLSANNDPKIGEIVAEAFDKVGKYGIVQFEPGEKTEDEVKFSQGFKIERGFFSPLLITNRSEGISVLENCVVHISQTKMEESKETDEIASKIFNENKSLPEDKKKSLLLMAPNFDSEITLSFRRNMFMPNGDFKFKAGMVVSPAFGAKREESIEDIKIILGESMMCDKVIITKDSTTFIGYHPDQEKFDRRVKEIESILSTNLPLIERTYHEKRLANFIAGMATIYVGGYSDTEVKNKIDLYEDAVCATQRALEEGVLPGGGAALENSSVLEGIPHLKECLRYPKELLEASIADKIVLRTIPDDPFWVTRDYKNYHFGDGLEIGIIDPFPVVKATLENAVSAASNILTCNCIIKNDL